MIFRLESWHINRGQVELALIYPQRQRHFSTCSDACCQTLNCSCRCRSKGPLPSCSDGLPIQGHEIGVKKCENVFSCQIYSCLLSIISCTSILSNEKVNLYVNENLQGHVHNLKLQQIGNILHFR